MYQKAVPGTSNTADDNQCLLWGGTCANGKLLEPANMRLKDNQCASCNTGFYLLFLESRCAACFQSKCAQGTYRTGTCDATTGQGYKCNACVQNPLTGYVHREAAAILLNALVSVCALPVLPLGGPSAGAAGCCLYSLGQCGGGRCTVAFRNTH